MGKKTYQPEEWPNGALVQQRKAAHERKASRTDSKLSTFSGYTCSDEWKVLNFLLHIRKESFSINQMGLRMGVKPQAVGRMEKSLLRADDDPSFRPPSLKMLRKYANALGLEVRLAISLPDGSAVNLFNYRSPDAPEKY